MKKKAEPQFDEAEIDKIVQELAAYAKTKCLQPGESENMTISFPVSRMASYDEKQAAWIWEKGSYILRVGEHSRATKVAGVIHLEKECIYQKQERMAEISILGKVIIKPGKFES